MIIQYGLLDYALVRDNVTNILRNFHSMVVGIVKRVCAKFDNPRTILRGNLQNLSQFPNTLLVGVVGSYVDYCILVHVLHVSDYTWIEDKDYSGHEQALIFSCYIESIYFRNEITADIPVGVDCFANERSFLFRIHSLF